MGCNHGCPSTIYLPISWDTAAFFLSAEPFVTNTGIVIARPHSPTPPLALYGLCLQRSSVMAPHDMQDEGPTDLSLKAEAGDQLLPPPPPPMSASPPRLLIIGAGSRGTAYASAITSVSNAQIVAIAETVESKRIAFGEKWIWGPKPEVPRYGYVN